ncbi:OLC1v1031407C1 [Oldenlandia corymbosa var. corymbosa]|uniref:OLC1v1031407C1 n=1 Tax=Oldenlandia corymbosa var. corymbosa TaxID=529605 RepID=A0AAV1CK64_OLDCO|nr:OLC1v1031407C1 [Oldenlandia corymbosa var. corymbosa]
MKFKLNRFDQGDGIDYSPAFATDETFATKKEAAAYAKGIANFYNMELSVFSHKDNTTILLCHKGGRYQGQQVGENVRARANTKTQMTGCQFRVTIYKTYDRWAIRVYPGPLGMHNYSLKDPPRVRRPLSEEVKELIKEYSKAGTKAVHILRAIWTQFPDEKVTSKQVYNYRNFLRKAGFPILDDLSAVDIVGKVLEVAEQHNYIIFTECDEETQRLSHVFFAHPDSLLLLRTYPWVVCVDSTYNTNKYKLPLVEFVGMTPCNQTFLIAYAILSDETGDSYHWALWQLRNLYGEDLHPSVIVTDREPGLMRPLDDVFPSSHHLLCTWHVYRDVERNVKRILNGNAHVAKSFAYNAFKVVIKAANREVYEEKVQFLEHNWSQFQPVLEYVKKTWLVVAHKFVHAWTNTYLHFGNTTTCRVESAHKLLKEWLCIPNASFETVWHRVHMLLETQLTQIRQLVEELDAAKEPIQREITRLMYNKLHPGQAGLNEPRVGKRGKGRPKKRGISKKSKTNQMCGHTGTAIRGAPIPAVPVKQVHGLGKVRRTPAVPVEATGRVPNPMSEVGKITCKSRAYTVDWYLRRSLDVNRGLLSPCYIFQCCCVLLQNQRC